MPINYNKCPRCGSLNIIKILYGMSTYNNFLITAEGKLKISNENKPEYYCKNCENEWDRITIIDHAYNEIIGIKTFVGGYFGPNYEVNIDFQSRQLKWSRLDSDNESSYEKTIRQTTLNKLIYELKILNLLDWKPRYINPGIYDGTQWYLELIRNGRNIKKSGDNNFPNEWDDFCRLIRNVTGKKFR